MNASTSPSVSWEFTWYQGLDTQVLCTIQGEGSDSFCSSPFTHQRVMELISLQLSNWLLVIVRLPSSEKPLTMQQEKRLPTHPDSLPSSPVTTTGKKDFPLLTSRYRIGEDWHSHSSTCNLILQSGLHYLRQMIFSHRTRNGHSHTLPGVI